MTSSPNKLDPLVLSVLACPACEARPRLTQNEAGELICEACKREYAITGGIPRMVVSEAAPAADG
jgi:uncharacterized protein YbaR (Trm112 family)